MTGPLRTLGVLAVVLVFASAADAATPGEKCRATIIKEAGKYVAARAKTIGKCNEALLKDKPGFGPAGGGCDDGDSKTSDKLAKTTSKFRAKIDKACGGGNQTCDGVGDIPLFVYGWDLGQCPNFEKGACTNDLDHCGDVADCLLCINDAAVAQAVDLYYAALDQGVDPGSAVGKCQKTIGKETTKFLLAKSKVLAKCWAAIDKGKVGFTVPCPGGDASGKTVEKIAKAESKKIAKLCKACGGGDKACDDLVTATDGTPFPGSGGSDDTPPGVIGFTGTCPDVTIPGGIGCGGPVTTLAELVECVDCVTEFKADCLDATVVPHHVSVDPACNLGCGDGIVDSGAGEQCETPLDCGVDEDCNEICLCEAIPALGSRTVSASVNSGFFNGFIPNTPVGVPTGSIVLDAGSPSAIDGLASITLGAGAPFIISTDIPLGTGQTVCDRISSCIGFIDCDGGTNVDPEQELDSLAAAAAPCVQDGTNSCPNLPSSECCSNACEGVMVGSGNLDVPAQGVGGGSSGAGAVEILCSIDTAVLSLGGDCSTATYSGPTRSVVLTTGTATARVIQHCAGSGTPPDEVVDLAKTGANFNCATWTTENSAGALVFATPTEEASSILTGDSSNAVFLDD